MSPSTTASAAVSSAPAMKCDDLVLSVQNVSKHFKLWSSPAERLRYSVYSQLHRTLRTVLPAGSALSGIARRRDALYADFTALHELSFNVRRGESVGILGRNGAGKSTLLQIIAGTLRPSTGRVEVYGRTAALLELGSGFNMEFTGRENVYLNAATLGFSQAEVEAKFDDIAAFADIGQFLDQPVKTYSSGMMVRLAFSVQMAVDPTLFIIDEALAVGDIYFQNKCNKLLRRKLAEGLTLLLVSHNPAAIRSLCQRGIVLDHGRCAFVGASDEAVNNYHSLGNPRRNGAPAADDGGAAFSEAGGEQDALPAKSGFESVPQGFGQIQDEVGSREVVLTGCELYNAGGKPCHEFTPGDPIRIGFTFRSAMELNDLIVGYSIRDKFNNVVSAGTNVNRRLDIGTVQKNQLYVEFLTLAGRLGPGEYLVDLGIGSKPDQAGSPCHLYHRVGGITAFGVSWDHRMPTFQGICDLEPEFVAPRPV